MNRHFACCCPFIVLFAAALPAADLPLTLEETLVELTPQHRASWTMHTNLAFVVGRDSLVLHGRADRDVTARHRRGLMRGTRTYFPEYCASGRVKIAFEYRADVKGASAGFYYCSLLHGYASGGPRASTNLPVTVEWRPAELFVNIPPYEGYESDISFSLRKGAVGTFEIRRLRVTEVPPENGHSCPFSERRALTANGTRLTEIALLRTADELTMRNERRAALMLRYALYRNGYEYLPIREYSENAHSCAFGNLFRRTDTPVRSEEKKTSAKENGQECPFSVKGKICVGRAAEGTGLFSNDFFSDQELETIHTKLGTGAYAVKGGAVGIAGNCPGGPQLGAYLFFRSLGIEYLGTDVWHCENRTEATGRVVKVPAIPYRSAMGRWGMHPELRGMLSEGEIIGDLAAGWAPAEHFGLCHDSLGFIVPMTEFDATHPEFFALQKDGTRMDAKRFQLGHCQFCWSNPELKKLVIERYLDIMRASPGVRYFCFAPGDGGGRECTCADCKKRGDNSTALVELMNEIGAAIGKEFPNNAIYTYSYATTLAAPKVDHIDPHVKFTDSIYMPSHWGSSQRWEHPANKKGFEELAKWRELAPDMGVMGYYESCSQIEHVWPAIPGWIAMHRDFARHGAWFVDRTYGNVAHAGCIANTSACGDMAWNVIPQVEIDPEVDDAALRERHMKLFFGPAADAMSRYLAALEKELVDRDWVENCEWPRRGFITPANAERFLALLDEAAAACGGSQGVPALATKTAAKSCGQGVPALATKNAKPCGQGVPALATKNAKSCGQGVPALAYLHRVKRERHIFLLTYLKDVNRGRGNVPSADYERWAKRVGEFITLSRETSQHYFGYLDVYKWFRDALQYKLENTRGYWLSEKDQLDRIVKDPVNELGGAVPNVQEKTEKGFRIPVKGLQGGEYQPKCVWKTAPRPALLLQRESSGKGVAVTALRLEKAPAKDLTLSVRGIDGPTDGPAKIELKVNGQVVCAGDVPWKKDAWSTASWTIPAALLQAGANDIAIRNATPDFEKDGDCGAAFAAKRNYYRGWFLVGDLEFEISRGDAETQRK